MDEQARETAGVTTRLIVAYVRRHLGDAAVVQLLALAGETRPVDVLEDERSWSSYRQKIALFEAAHELTGDEWVAHRIGQSVLTEQLGGLVRMVIGTLGSPQRVLRSVAGANAKFSTSSTMRALEVGSGHAVVAYRLHEEHEPNLHDCRYTQGVLSQVTVLFGLPAPEVEHHRCQVEGADECVYEVSWPRWRWWVRGLGRPRMDAAAETLQQQLVDVGRTVADLVSADDLDRVLERIALRAGMAVRAQRHLLVVRVDGRDVVHADGLEPDEALAIGDELLASGGLSLPGHRSIVAPIVSARHDYGWLAAMMPDDAGFLPAEQGHLETYAGLAAAALDVTTALQDARRSGRTSAALLHLSRRLAHEDDERAVAVMVAEAAPIVVGSDRARVLLWDEEQSAMATVAAVGYDDPDQAHSLVIPYEATPELHRLFSDPGPRHFELGSGDPFIDATLQRFGHDSVHIAPILNQAELIGMVFATRIEDRRTTQETQRTLESLASLADQAGLAIGRLRLLEETVHAATHDHLTGLAGRRLFHDRAERALADNRRDGRHTAIGFIDLDGFKQVNDTYGHAAGDALLVEVAQVIREAVRETDSVARMAGDEFAVLLRGLEDPADAVPIARGLTAQLRRCYDLDGCSPTVTASVGIAVSPDHGATCDGLLKAADAAMYEAKQRGGAYRFADTPVMTGPFTPPGRRVRSAPGSDAGRGHVR